MLKAAFGRACSGLAWALNTQKENRSFRQYRLVVSLGAAAAGAFAIEAAADASSTDAGNLPAALPTDKLACHQHVAAPRRPVVLLSCGSFNPPTVMHLRMFDLATAGLAKRGYDVWGCYMSPVADAYGKEGLAPVRDRLQMCQLAAADTANVMVTNWEASQLGYTRTLQVLRHVSESLTAYMQQASCTDPNTSSIQHQQRTTHAAGLKQTAAGPQPLGSAECNIPGAPNNNSRGAISHRNSSRIDSKTASNTGSTIAVAPEQQVPCVMLLCGADLLATIAQPGVWKDPDIILRDYGIVCICREGTNMQQLFGQPESLLHKYRNNIIVHEEPVPNGMSSTKVRQLLADDQPVRYLLPDSVIAYIKQHGLYKV